MRDFYSWWDNTKFQNTLEKKSDTVCLNSNNSLISNSISRKNLKDALANEFKFFEKVYFLSRTRKVAKINFYYTGHGEIGFIKLIDFNTNYSELIEHIFQSANK